MEDYRGLSWNCRWSTSVAQRYWHIKEKNELPILFFVTERFAKKAPWIGILERFAADTTKLTGENMLRANSAAWNADRDHSSDWAPMSAKIETVTFWCVKKISLFVWLEGDILTRMRGWLQSWDFFSFSLYKDIMFNWGWAVTCFTNFIASNDRWKVSQYSCNLTQVSGFTLSVDCCCWWCIAVLSALFFLWALKQSIHIWWVLVFQPVVPSEYMLKSILQSG